MPDPIIPDTKLEGLVAEVRDAIDGGGGGGGATAAKQDAQTALLTQIEENTSDITIDADSINLNTDQLEALLTTSNTKQDTGNTSLSSIDGKITAVNTGAVTISTALPAGSNAIGKLAANTGVTIGAVEIAATQTLSTVTTVTTVSTLSGGPVAHDGVASGNPHQIGLLASRVRPTAVSADGDVARATCDRYGRTRIVGVELTPISLDATASGDTVLVAAPGASTRIKLLRVEASNTSTTTAITVGLKSASLNSGAVFGKKILGAYGPAIWDFSPNHLQCGVNEALSVNLSAAGTVSFTAYYETVAD